MLLLAQACGECLICSEVGCTTTLEQIPKQLNHTRWAMSRIAPALVTLPLVTSTMSTLPLSSVQQRTRLEPCELVLAEPGRGGGGWPTRFANLANQAARAACLRCRTRRTRGGCKRGMAPQHPAMSLHRHRLWHHRITHPSPGRARWCGNDHRRDRASPVLRQGRSGARRCASDKEQGPAYDI